MEHFDKMRDKLREENGLPDDLGWEQMEEGIFEQMDAANTASDREERTGIFDFTKYIFLLLLGAMALWFIVGNFTKAPKDERAITSTKANPKQEIKTGSIGSAVLELAGEELVNLKHKEEESKGLVEVQRIFEEENAVKKENRLGEKTLLEAINKRNNIEENRIFLGEGRRDEGFSTSVERPVLKKDEINENKRTLLQIRKEASGVSSSSISTSKPIEQNRELAALPKVEPLESRGIASLISDLNELPETKRIGLSKPKRKDKISLSAGIALNNWSSRHFDDLETGVSEKGIWGYSASLRVSYPLGKSLYISLGANYAKMHSKLDATLEEDTLVSYNTLLYLVKDAYSGSISEVYGDTLLQETTTRRIIHYNHYSQWSLPLVVGYRKQIGNLEYNIGLGMSFDIQNTARARSIINGTPLDYSYTGKASAKGVGLSALGELGIKYHVNDRFFTSVRLNYAHQLNHWNIDLPNGITPKVINGTISLGIKL